MLDATKRPNLRPGQGKATLRGQTIFFFQYRDFSLISNIKSFTGTKYIWTTSCRNWKACVIFFSSSNPTQFLKKKKKYQLNRTIVWIIQITSRCTDFGFQSRQDKTFINLMVEQGSISYQIDKKIKILLPFLLDQDNIYRCRVTTLSKVALKNMKHTEEIVKSLDGFGDGSPWSESSSGWDHYGLYIVLYIKKNNHHSNTLPYTAHHFSVWQFSSLIVVPPHVTFPGNQKQSLLAGMYRKVLHYTLREL